jgi:hypothetical protein
MKLLAVSDQIVDRLYTSSVTTTYPDLQMLIGCGDLPYSYLEFLVTLYNIPLFYVPGNHDPAYSASPGAHVEGGFNLDGQVVASKGLLLAGLGGSLRYHENTPNQYSQRDMYLRVYRLMSKIYLHSWRRPLDLLITHSPPYGIHDDDDPAHQGLKALNLLIRWAKPRYFLHGHTLFYRQNLVSHISRYYSTQVINIFPFRILEIDPAVPDHTGRASP